jgi:hypothetical protein
VALHLLELAIRVGDSSVATATLLNDRHPELVESCALGTRKIESSHAGGTIPQGEGSRERTESTTSNYFAFLKWPGKQVVWATNQSQTLISNFL